MPDNYLEAKRGKLEYGLFIPEIKNKTDKYPLVMFLHGWSVNYTVYLKWYNEEFQQKNP